MITPESGAISGLVFDIQRYSLHDGPGIRTLVFLKGCPLRCRWCSNPESQDKNPQVFYVKSRCIRCGQCVSHCPNGEITMGKDDIMLNWEAIGKLDDLEWVKVCPTKALTVKGQTMTVDQLMEIILKDEVFYRQSGGGVTISGGEPMIQPEFVFALLKRLHAEGISTAVETTGAVSEESLLAILPFVDLFLYDFKHCDEEAHIKFIGTSNKIILKNLKLLADHRANILVRTPLIPEVNDSKSCVRKIMAILQEYGIKKYALLPFHQFGSGKYSSIGMPYGMQETKAPRESRVACLRQMIQEAGFTSDY